MKGTDHLKNGIIGSSLGGGVVKGKGNSMYKAPPKEEVYLVFCRTKGGWYASNIVDEWKMEQSEIGWDGRKQSWQEECFE